MLWRCFSKAVATAHAPPKAFSFICASLSTTSTGTWKFLHANSSNYIMYIIFKKVREISATKRNGEVYRDRETKHAENCELFASSARYHPHDI